MRPQSVPQNSRRAAGPRGCGGAKAPTQCARARAELSHVEHSAPAALPQQRLVDREATTEVGFGFTPLVLRRAVKPLFTMLLRRSDNVLRLFIGGFVSAPFSPSSRAFASEESNRRDARPKQLPGSSAGCDTFRHVYAQLPHCRGGAIAHNQYDRSAHCHWRNHPAAVAATVAAPHSESEFSKSRRRHSSVISMRQIRPTLAVSSIFCS